MSKRTDVPNETFTPMNLCPGRALQELSDIKNVFTFLHSRNVLCYEGDDLAPIDKHFQLKCYSNIKYWVDEDCQQIVLLYQPMVAQSAC